MLVVLKKVGQEPEVIEIDGSLESMQKIVGGYIEAYPIANTDYCIILNEEGKVKELPVNFGVVTFDPIPHIEMINGDVFICTCGEEDFEGLLEDDIKLVKSLFEDDIWQVVI